MTEEKKKRIPDTDKNAGDFLDILRRETGKNAYRERMESASDQSHPAHDILYEYATGVSDHQEVAAVSDHIAVCASCADKILEIERMENELRQEYLEWADSSEKRETGVKAIRRLKQRVGPGFFRHVSTLLGYKSLLVATAVCLALFFIMRGPDDSPFGMRITVIGNPAPEGKIRGTKNGFELKEGAALKSGDCFKVGIHLDEPAWLYVILRHSSGGIYTWSPGSVEAGTSFLVFDGKDRIQLDKNTGTVTITAVASKTEIGQFDEKVAKLEKDEELEQMFGNVSVRTFRFEHQ